MYRPSNRRARCRPRRGAGPRRGSGRRPNRAAPVGRPGDEGGCQGRRAAPGRRLGSAAAGCPRPGRPADRRTGNAPAGPGRGRAACPRQRFPLRPGREARPLQVAPAAREEAARRRLASADPAVRPGGGEGDRRHHRPRSAPAGDDQGAQRADVRGPSGDDPSARTRERSWRSRCRAFAWSRSSSIS